MPFLAYLDRPVTDLRLLLLVRSAHDALSAILDRDRPIGRPDAHLSDKLGLDGLWTPAWLEIENAPYIERADAAGNIGPPAPDHDGDPSTMSRGPLLLASGFFFDRCLDRSDLTPLQAASIHDATQWAGGAFDAQTDEMTALPRMTWRFRSGWDAAGVQRPGAHPLALGFARYQTADQVKLAYRRLLQICYGP